MQYTRFLPLQLKKEYRGADLVMMLTSVPTGRTPESDVVKVVGLPSGGGLGSYFTKRLQREVNFKLGHAEHPRVAVRLFRGLREPSEHRYLVFYYPEGLYEQIKRMLEDGSVFKGEGRPDDNGIKDQKWAARRVARGVFEMK